MDTALIVNHVEAEQNRRISEAIRQEGARLRNFIRKRVPDPRDVDDILQDAFYELTEAFRSSQPVEHPAAWLFRVVRNRIVDLFRRKPVGSLSDPVASGETGEALLLEDLLPSPEDSPEAAYLRRALLEELEEALDELPDERREVFLAHEIEGRSFKEIAAKTGVSVNTLLSRKHYAVLYLRRRLQKIYDELKKG
jgi:RNA polymerase sigma factor (sigma-70 family)